MQGQVVLNASAPRRLASAVLCALALALVGRIVLTVPTAHEFKTKSAVVQSHPIPSAHAPVTATQRIPARVAQANRYYAALWGVVELRAQSTASGNLIRFSYRVVDPARAAPLGDERAEPQLVDPRSGVVLKVPMFEKVGPLRQKGAPVAGKDYWMAFSNKGNFVKRGDRVDVIVGSVRIEGLVVE